MSNKYRSTRLCYLIDHHSPQPPAVPLGNMDPQEYKAFVQESGVDSQMVYCKDHWGVTYYPSKVKGARMHEGAGKDWVTLAAEILRGSGVEFIAYYCIEYDEGAARLHPEWRVRKADGSPLIRADKFARWSLCCTQTGYRRYCLDQLKEIAESYRPDSMFLDIFGTSLCYCSNCREKFLKTRGYPLPETEKELAQRQVDVLEYLDMNAAEFLDEIRNEMDKIDPTLAITVNFSCHYPAIIREKLSYQFSEPLLGDNWFSAAYARDAAEGRFPIMAPGEASQVYNYSPVNKYRFELHAIAAQGCRVGMYSGSQHIDGTLEHEEARRLGVVYRELADMAPHLAGRTPLEGVGILQSDASVRINTGGIIPDAILRAKAHNPHIRALLGAMRLCENAKIPWRMLPEHSLTEKSLEGYSILLLPEVFVLSRQTAAILENYVRKGGNLLISPNSGRFHSNGEQRGSFALADLMGVDFAAIHSEYRRNEWDAYLTPCIGKDFTGLLNVTTPPVSGAFTEVRLREGEALLRFVLPCIAVTDDLWVNWWSPPPGETTSLPALTCRRVGAGHAAYCAFDLFSMAELGGFNYLDELFIQLLEMMDAEPPVRLMTDSPLLLRTGFFRRGDELLVHQLSDLPHWFRGQVSPVGGGSLRINSEFLQVKTARVIWPEIKNLEVRQEEDTCEIDLPDFELGQIVSCLVAT